jgi:hypothetical protein
MKIKSFLTRLWAAIKRMFEGFDDEVKTAIHISVTLVENLKNFVESPAADVLTTVIPSQLDNRLKNWLRVKLPGILQQLKLADAQLTDDSEIVIQAAKQLKQMQGSVKSGFLHSLSILIAQIVADGKLTWDDGVYILQWYYQYRFKNSN